MLPNGAGNNRDNDEEILLDEEEFNIALTVLKVIMLVIVMVPLAEYSIISKKEANQTEIDQIPNLKTIDESKQDSLKILTENTDKEYLEASKRTKNILRKLEPTCPRRNTLVILEDICEELILKAIYCTPEDFYNIDKHMIPKRIVRNRSKKEAKVPAIVNYAMGIILMTSLGAALLELYKAKREPEKKDGKNSLSRKCSLADLTVMKHQRKEMVRRESLLEVPEESLYTKQLDHRPSPLHRQCSFPVGPSSLPTIGTPPSRRRLSVQATRFIPVVDGRPAAVLEGGRRHSIVSDGRQALIFEDKRTSVDGRAAILDRAALEDSPERRLFHGRNRRVHRH